MPPRPQACCLILQEQTAVIQDMEQMAQAVRLALVLPETCQVGLVAGVSVAPWPVEVRWAGHGTCLMTLSPFLVDDLQWAGSQKVSALLQAGSQQSIEAHHLRHQLPLAAFSGLPGNRRASRERCH